ncbi:hypothetical protein EH165_09735 [Nakamurella antarctica]|uniref:Uncharacterized protein n=1 Tax=Nakamurella antarctica TaxID=1902245 RepID=A0A3G8ZQE2_9ACTN|nr:hypothetical protein EH165_09735 [Nakamurella antarctica]
MLIKHVATAEKEKCVGNDDVDRGDVPGWVMITVMTSIVVIGLLAVFGPAVEEAVRSAFANITG